jgi:hypothetical protein
MFIYSVIMVLYIIIYIIYINNINNNILGYKGITGDYRVPNNI